MIVFPYKDEDLMRKGDFIRYCIHRGYRLNDDFLDFLKESKFLMPLAKLEDSDPKKQIDCYSKFQFYLVRRILEERYEEYFFRTFFSHNKDIKRYDEETQKHLKSFDKSYFEHIYPQQVDFFNLYYEIDKEYLLFRKRYIKELHRVSKENGSSIDATDSNGTVRKSLIKELQKKYTKENSSKEEKIIDVFITSILIKYKKYIKVYGSMQGNKDFFKIPEALIVQDFIEDILVVVEWYFETRNIPFDRRITGIQIGNWCTICGKDFKRIRYNQKTCGGECSKLYKNQYRTEKRKTNKGYSRSKKELIRKK